MSAQRAEQYWRDGYDYRAEYFKRKPGILGVLWFCSQCGKPLLGKDKVEVDHGFPPSFFAKKKYDRHGKLVKNDSLLARAMNKPFNLVACCKDCNRSKSDKIGLVTVKAVIAQLLETGYFGAQRLGVLGFTLGVKLTHFTLSKGFKVLSSPLRKKGNPWYVKLLILGLYIGFVFYLVKSLQ